MTVEHVQGCPGGFQGQEQAPQSSVAQQAAPPHAGQSHQVISAAPSLQGNIQQDWQIPAKPSTSPVAEPSSALHLEAVAQQDAPALWNKDEPSSQAPSSIDRLRLAMPDHGLLKGAPQGDFEEAFNALQGLEGAAVSQSGQGVADPLQKSHGLTQGPPTSAADLGQAHADITLAYPGNQSNVHTKLPAGSAFEASQLGRQQTATEHAAENPSAIFAATNALVQSDDGKSKLCSAACQPEQIASASPRAEDVRPVRPPRAALLAALQSPSASEGRQACHQVAVPAQDEPSQMQPAGKYFPP